MKDPRYFAAKDDLCSRFTVWCSSASSEELILCPLPFPSVTVKAGCRLRWAPVTMHPMPVCSVSGGDIFDCIQRGNVEQCIQFLQTDRSVLKQKGKLGRDVIKSQCYPFLCSVCVQPRATISCVFLSVQPLTVTDGISSFAPFKSRKLLMNFIKRHNLLHLCHTSVTHILKRATQSRDKTW